MDRSLYLCGLAALAAAIVFDRAMRALDSARLLNMQSHGVMQAAAAFSDAVELEIATRGAPPIPGNEKPASEAPRAADGIAARELAAGPIPDRKLDLAASLEMGIPVAEPSS
jgi:hypothetical protein